MNTPDNIEKLIQNTVIHSNPDVNKTVLKDLLQQFDNTREQKPAVMQPNIRRTIMKSLSAKIAIAAVIIVAVVLGLFEFIGGDNGSGVVWAEVARKVQASGSLVLRIRETGTMAIGEADYTIKYFSPAGARSDVYKNGQVLQSQCSNAETMTTTVINYSDKRYYTYQPGEGIEGFLEKKEDWTNPIYLVQTILSVEHTALGEKTVDGILCEGLETSDPAVMGDAVNNMANRLDVHMELWVDVQTQYPVRFEIRVVAEAEGQAFELDCVMDQFQWDADIDPSRFELEIPDDYYKQM